VAEAFNFVEQCMVKRRDGFRDDFIDFPKIPYPAFVLLCVAFDAHSASKGMTMNLLKKIIGPFVLEIMRGFELKIFFNLKYEVRRGHYDLKNARGGHFPLYQSREIENVDQKENQSRHFSDSHTPQDKHK